MANTMIMKMMMMMANKRKVKQYGDALALTLCCYFLNLQILKLKLVTLRFIGLAAWDGMNFVCVVYGSGGCF